MGRENGGKVAVGAQEDFLGLFEGGKEGRT